MTTQAYTISSKSTGAILGSYRAESQEAALEILAADAGYDSWADACETTDDPEDASHLEIREWTYDAEDVTDAEIEAHSDSLDSLRSDAGQAGDIELVALCDWASEGDAPALSVCVRRMADAAAEVA